MTVQLIFQSLLSLFEFDDFVFELRLLFAELRVMTPGSADRVDFRIDLIEFLVEFGESAATVIYIEDLFAGCANSVDQLKQFLSVKAEGQRINMLGPFSRFERRQLLQFVQADGEDAFENGFVDVANDVSQ